MREGSPDPGLRADPDAGQAARAACRRRRLRIGLIVLALALPASLALAELAFRHLLFGASSLAQRYRHLRNPHFYADWKSEDDFWKLQRRFTRPKQRDQYVHRDERLGWLSVYIEPGTYRHKAEGWLAGRRPVLMYGDSFTACLTDYKDCWEGLMQEDPELSRSHVLVNYGTCAFGIDQAYLVLRDSLDHWVERSPVVVFGVLVDDDIDRTLLGFRGCPKPIPRLAGGALEFEYPGAPDIDEWIAENPIARGSYLWRYLTFKRPSLPAFLRPMDPEHPSLIERKSAIGRAVVEAVKAEADARGVELIFMLFHEPRSAARLAPADWREALLVGALEELGIPYVSSKHALHHDMRLTGRKLGRYFMNEGPGTGHLNEEGNRAVYRAIVRGLRGEYDWAPGMPSRLSGSELAQR